VKKLQDQFNCLPEPDPIPKLPSQMEEIEQQHAISRI